MVTVIIICLWILIDSGVDNLVGVIIDRYNLFEALVICQEIIWAENFWVYFVKFNKTIIDKNNLFEAL